MSKTITTASPWDALLRAAPACRSAEASPEATESKPGTKLAGLLEELATRESATTATLAVCADLEPRLVWGLLKTPRDRGQVRFEAGRWSLVAGARVCRAGRGAGSSTAAGARVAG